jgi:hypothetical protein
MTKKKSKSVVVAQKAPKKNKNTAVWDLVMEDIKERDKNGKAKYGVRLQTFNGRNAEVDAYQEVLDLTVYFRQLIEEKKEIVELLKKVHNPWSTDPYAKNHDIVNSNSELAGELLEKLGELDEV